MEKIKTDLLVIGAGSGGLSVAAGAVQMGAKVVLLEDHKMGGDCLNYGCVPSEVIETIEPVDSQERFEGLGVHVIRERGRFVDENTVQAGDHQIMARRIVVATGSSPFVPPIPGL